MKKTGGATLPIFDLHPPGQSLGTIAGKPLEACQNNPQKQLPEQSKQNTSNLPHTPPNSNSLQKSHLTPAAMTDIQTPQPQSKQADLFSTLTEHIAKLELAVANLSEQINQFKGIIRRLQS